MEVSAEPRHDRNVASFLNDRVAAAAPLAHLCRLSVVLGNRSQMRGGWDGWMVLGGRWVARWEEDGNAMVDKTQFGKACSGK